MSLYDEKLAEKVKLFYGEFPVWQLLQFYFTEFYHHYGQLTVYARIINLVPPFAYDFE
jgi:uncharacterized damage-inducible protein DinB